MSKSIFALILAITATAMLPLSASAASDCEAKAVSKDGKPLAGAAKAASIKKCESATKAAAPVVKCEDKAIDKNGKPLAGAAKTAFIKKCEKAPA